MALGSINVTRVSHNMRTQSMLESMQRGQLLLFTEQARLAAGRRFLAPSEDPAAAAQTLHMSEILEQREQLVLNVQHGDNMLTAADKALTDANDLLVEAHGIASQNLGSLASEDEREAAAELIASIINRFAVVANRQFQGRYLFAGRDSGEQPFNCADGGIIYTGDTGRLSVRVGETELDTVSFSGDEVFGALTGRVGSQVDLDPRLTEDSRLEDINGANNMGIRRGQLIINEEGGAGVFQVDLTGADTMGDVVDLINQAAAEAGATVTASLTDDGLQIEPGASPVSVTDTSTGIIASDLGVLTPTPQAAVIVGADLNVRLTATTRVEDLMDGAGVNLDDSILITNGALTAVVDLSEAETVQDILNKIKNAHVNVVAKINAEGTGIDVINLVSGTAMSVGENGGTTATDLGIRSSDLDTLLSDLNDGRGVETEIGEDDIRITAKDGSTVDINLDGAETIGDVIDIINAAAAAAGVAVTASLAEVGNGIRIVDATGGAGPLIVSRLNLSYAIDDLGLEKFASDPATELVSDDTNLIRADSVFTALYDLERGLRNNSDREITMAAERLHEFTEDMTRVRGVIGSQSKSFEDRLTQLENVKFSTQEFLSQIKDVDYAESITRFQQYQTALQASLMVGSRLMGLSLMDFI
ncbi:MAG: hypothetical protein JSV19_10590 [Phycisphaerales bacterium]|nr:MAG: hypothetical protein JSV19_10590 [Phycisphaerales bacterium]